MPAASFAQGAYKLAEAFCRACESQFKSSVIEFDALDKWVGADFDIHLEKILDTFFDKVEEDLLSVWSTNKSEQESANLSA